jgi:hypothetical protein
MQLSHSQKHIRVVDELMSGTHIRAKGSLSWRAYAWPLKLSSVHGLTR